MIKTVQLILISAFLLFSACTSSNNVPVDLSVEEISRHENTIKEYGDKIINFMPPETPPEIIEEEMLTEEGVLIIEKEKSFEKPPVDWFVEKYRAEKSLGRIDDAIKTMEEVFDYYDNSSVASHNLGRIHEDLGDCKTAEKHYQALIDNFDRQEYNYDIARCYLRHTSDQEKVRSYYLLHLNEGGNPDSEIENFLTESEAL